MDGMFDVALWKRWPAYDLPVIGVVEAPDAILAVVALMRVHGWTRAAHVAAGVIGGGLVHRAYGVTIVPEEKESGEEEWEPAWEDMWASAGGG